MEPAIAAYIFLALWIVAVAFHAHGRLALQEMEYAFQTMPIPEPMYVEKIVYQKPNVVTLRSMVKIPYLQIQYANNDTEKGRILSEAHRQVKFSLMNTIEKHIQIESFQNYADDCLRFEAILKVVVK